MKQSDLYWTAGFLEGEGCFLYLKRQSGHGYETRVEATQVNETPLIKLKHLFGGTIHIRKRSTRNQSDYFRWRINGDGARNVMRLMLPLLMSGKQKKRCLAALKGMG